MSILTRVLVKSGKTFTVFKWLYSLFRQTGDGNPRVVITDDQGVTFADRDGSVARVLWGELTKVEIVTTDHGPYAEDVFALLHSEQRDCVVVPSDVDGWGGILEHLEKLPEFNSHAVCEALCCTSNARFAVWKRQPGGTL